MPAVLGKLTEDRLRGARGAPPLRYFPPIAPLILAHHPSKWTLESRTRFLQSCAGLLLRLR